jgi:hypothetical protein
MQNNNNLPLGHQTGANMGEPQNPFPEFKSEYTDFIATYTGVFDDEWCEKTIEHFNYLKGQGLTFNRQFQQHAKHSQDDDSYLPTEEWDHSVRIRNSFINQCFTIGMDYCLNDYMTKYSILQTVQPMKIMSTRIQETKVGGGYHTWHLESGSNLTCYRKLVCMVYLNDVQNGGETEFLYQSLRIKPTKGTAIVWPSEFTHTHRGNPPLSNNKFIITSWFEFA